MQITIKIKKKEDNLYQLLIKLILKENIEFIFRNVYLLQKEKLIIRTPYITTTIGKRLSFIFSDKFKNVIAYHTIKNAKFSDLIEIDAFGSPSLFFKKVKEFERIYETYETNGIYNLFIGKLVQIKHLTLISRDNRPHLIFPNSGDYNDICFPANSPTRLFVEKEIVKLSNINKPHH